ncbi:MAG: sulfide/dihydroorotate dehydrogenase-like FAD/NAD-binding protein [candidate division Zixibacteria bacterium]|nr:sulfide/dihydroorotate dehydrogenase-like FAD/NAD-binding protein [candidate division Zixibacteria bacterium]
MENNEIAYKEELCPKITMFKIYVPELVKKANAGQFIILRAYDHSERIPMSIGHLEREKGLLTVVVMEVGMSTAEIVRMEVGEKFQDVVGPLGVPTHVNKYGTCVVIGGGVGIPPINPIARALKAEGNKVIGIIGARNKDLVILEDLLKEATDDLVVTTDDGSYGMKGFVTDALQKLIDDGEKIDFVMAIGPVIMMKNVSKLTEKYDIETWVSLNPIMVDGTGMCGGCRVTIGGETKFACVDGPDFDGHKVDFDELTQRQRMYLPQEKKAYDDYLEHCRIGLKK